MKYVIWIAAVVGKTGKATLLTCIGHIRYFVTPIIDHDKVLRLFVLLLLYDLCVWDNLSVHIRRVHMCASSDLNYIIPNICFF